VGDTKSLLESELRDRNIKWMENARIDRVEEGKVFVTRFDDRGNEIGNTEVPFVHSMVLPAFRGIEAVRGIEGLVNPRGFVIVDEHQRNPKYPEIYSVGVCVAIPPMGPTPLPVGVPKTGYMIESMVTATAHNIRAVLDGKEPQEKATWNALCLADFGDSGVAFIAKPQIPPRNLNWASRGRWVHLAKIAFEKYFLRKVKKGVSEPIYEKVILEFIGLKKLRES
jgi:sulfide:quinone oxidoreductase